MKDTIFSRKGSENVIYLRKVYEDGVIINIPILEGELTVYCTKCGRQYALEADDLFNVANGATEFGNFICYECEKKMLHRLGGQSI